MDFIQININSFSAAKICVQVDILEVEPSYFRFPLYSIFTKLMNSYITCIHKSVYIVYSYILRLLIVWESQNLVFFFLSFFFKGGGVEILIMSYFKRKFQTKIKGNCPQASYVLLNCTYTTFFHLFLKTIVLPSIWFCFTFCTKFLCNAGNIQSEMLKSRKRRCKIIQINVMRL